MRACEYSRGLTGSPSSRGGRWWKGWLSLVLAAFILVAPPGIGLAYPDSAGELAAVGLGVAAVGLVVRRLTLR